LYLIILKPANKIGFFCVELVSIKQGRVGMEGREGSEEKVTNRRRGKEEGPLAIT